MAKKPKRANPGAAPSKAVNGVSLILQLTETHQAIVGLWMLADELTAAIMADMSPAFIAGQISYLWAKSLELRFSVERRVFAAAYLDLCKISGELKPATVGKSTADSSYHSAIHSFAIECIRTFSLPVVHRARERFQGDFPRLPDAESLQPGVTDEMPALKNLAREREPLSFRVLMSMLQLELAQAIRVVQESPGLAVTPEERPRTPLQQLAWEIYQAEMADGNVDPKRRTRIYDAFDALEENENDPVNRGSVKAQIIEYRNEYGWPWS